MLGVYNLIFWHYSTWLCLYLHTSVILLNGFTVFLIVFTSDWRIPEPTGQFKVGYREETIGVDRNTQIWVSIYYPTTTKDFNENKDNMKVFWAREGTNTTDGMAK